MQQAPPDAPILLDSLPPADTADAYGEVWARTGTAEPPPLGLERYMLQQDKLYVVLAVVLLIWFGLLFFLFRTDRRIARLERTLNREAPPPADPIP